MFKLFCFMVVAYLVYRFDSKHKQIVKLVWKKLKLAFSEPKSASSKQDPVEMAKELNQTSIPMNVRKDILKAQYLTLFQTKASPKKEAKNNTIKENSKQETNIEESNISKFNADTILADSNGEIHTLYDLSSAPVNQPKKSQREFSYAKKTTREEYRKKVASSEKQPHKVEKKEKETTVKPVPMNDLIRQVKQRLAQVDSTR